MPSEEPGLMTIQHIIFDLDGTLIDSARLTGQIIDAMLADRGVEETADRDMIRMMDAVGGEKMIAAVMGAHTVDPAADLEAFRARHRVAATPADLAFAGVAETLDALAQRGIRSAICSNKPQFLCEKILTDLGLARHFDAIIGSAPDRPRKPAPETARMALAALNGTAESTLYCGDSLVDLKTAQGAGLPMVLARWGYGAEEVIAHAPQIVAIDTMHDLVTLLHGHNP